MPAHRLSNMIDKMHAAKFAREREYQTKQEMRPPATAVDGLNHRRTSSGFHTPNNLERSPAVKTPSITQRG